MNTILFWIMIICFFTGHWIWGLITMVAWYWSEKREEKWESR